MDFDYEGPNIIEAYVQKKTKRVKGGVKTTWKYLRLNIQDKEKCLIMKNKKEDTNQQIFSIKSLDNFSIELNDEENVLNNQLGFKIITDKKTYVFFANKKEEHSKWVRILHYLFKKEDLLKPISKLVKRAIEINQNSQGNDIKLINKEDVVTKEDNKNNFIKENTNSNKIENNSNKGENNDLINKTDNNSNNKKIIGNISDKKYIIIDNNSNNEKIIDNISDKNKYIKANDNISDKKTDNKGNNNISDKQIDNKGNDNISDKKTDNNKSDKKTDNKDEINYQETITVDNQIILDETNKDKEQVIGNYSNFIKKNGKIKNDKKMPFELQEFVKRNIIIPNKTIQFEDEYYIKYTNAIIDNKSSKPVISIDDKSVKIVSKNTNDKFNNQVVFEETKSFKLEEDNKSSLNLKSNLSEKMHFQNEQFNQRITTLFNENHNNIDNANNLIPSTLVNKEDIKIMTQNKTISNIKVSNVNSEFVSRNSLLSTQNKDKLHKINQELSHGQYEKLHNPNEVIHIQTNHANNKIIYNDLTSINKKILETEGNIRDGNNIISDQEKCYYKNLKENKSSIPDLNKNPINEKLIHIEKNKVLNNHFLVPVVDVENKELDVSIILDLEREKLNEIVRKKLSKDLDNNWELKAGPTPFNSKNIIPEIIIKTEPQIRTYDLKKTGFYDDLSLHIKTGVINKRLVIENVKFHDVSQEINSVRSNTPDQLKTNKKTGGSELRDLLKLTNNNRDKTPPPKFNINNQKLEIDEKKIKKDNQEIKKENKNFIQSDTKLVKQSGKNFNVERKVFVDSDSESSAWEFTIKFTNKFNSKNNIENVVDPKIISKTEKQIELIKNKHATDSNLKSNLINSSNNNPKQNLINIVRDNRIIEIPQEWIKLNNYDDHQYVHHTFKFEKQTVLGDDYHIPVGNLAHVKVENTISKLKETTSANTNIKISVLNEKNYIKPSTENIQESMLFNKTILNRNEVDHKQIEENFAQNINNISSIMINYSMLDLDDGWDNSALNDP